MYNGWRWSRCGPRRFGWSLRRSRERVLRAAARVIVSGRRVTMIIGEAFAKSWQRLWPWLERL